MVTRKVMIAWTGCEHAPRNTPHAFSHFTFEASGAEQIVVDIQGVLGQISLYHPPLEILAIVAIANLQLYAMVAGYPCLLYTKTLEIPEPHPPQASARTVPLIFQRSP